MRKKELHYEAYRELASRITYKQYEKDDIIYYQGDDVKHMYIILNGTVAQVTKNEAIDQWDWAYNNYMALVQWKKKLDVTINESIRQQIDK